MSILHNIPLIAALVSIVTAQAAKVPIHALVRREWKLSPAFGTGGMPSSHSAAVASLACAVGILHGWSSSVFAVAAVLSAITMYDATGIRRHAGFHASLINQIVRSLPLHPQAGKQPRGELKELLGHRPAEVVGGAALGIVIGILLCGV